MAFVHLWVNFAGLRACRICGVVRRAAGDNRPCRGRVAITVRQETP